MVLSVTFAIKRLNKTHLTNLSLVASISKFVIWIRMIRKMKSPSFQSRIKIISPTLSRYFKTLTDQKKEKKSTIWYSHPLHTAIGQMCRGEKPGIIWQWGTVFHYAALRATQCPLPGSQGHHIKKIALIIRLCIQASNRNVSLPVLRTEIHPHNRVLKIKHRPTVSVTNLILDESLSEKREAVCTPHDSCLGPPEALKCSGMSLTNMLNDNAWSEKY